MIKSLRLMFERSKLDLLRDVSITRIGDTLSYGFPRTVLNRELHKASFQMRYWVQDYDCPSCLHQRDNFIELFLRSQTNSTRGKFCQDIYLEYFVIF